MAKQVSEAEPPIFVQSVRPALATLATRRFLSRKDIANLLEISVKCVENNEERLGLTPARRDLNARMVRYCTAAVLRELKRRNQLPE